MPEKAHTVTPRHVTNKHQKSDIQLFVFYHKKNNNNDVILLNKRVVFFKLCSFKMFALVACVHILVRPAVI